MTRIRTLAVVTLVLLLPAHSFAWRAAGHKIIASIAYQRMTADQRSHVAEILRHHPRFEEDFEELMPDDVAGADDETQDEWTFQQAAIWPDIARNFFHEPPEQRDFLRDEFHRSKWHYINVPHFLTDEAADELEGMLMLNLDLDPPADDIDDEDMNAIQCIRNSRAIVIDDDQELELRALHLCWLFHVMGDIHQPLHSTALFSTELLSEGDRGGNESNTRQRDNLHNRWDTFPGANILFSTARTRAVERQENDDLNAIGEAAETSLDEESWLDESHGLAAEHVYTAEVVGFLRALEQGGFTGDDLPDLDLSDDYQENGRAISDRRVVEAGYRMAKVLDEVQ